MRATVALRSLSIALILVAAAGAAPAVEHPAAARPGLASAPATGLLRSVIRRCGPGAVLPKAQPAAPGTGWSCGRWDVRVGQRTAGRPDGRAANAPAADGVTELRLRYRF